jgi:hypothetical protein
MVMFTEKIESFYFQQIVKTFETANRLPCSMFTG